MTKTPVRYHYMDSMRSVLMSMGVVIHSAMVFKTGKPWIISDPRQSLFFDGLIWLLHLFRMPAFFMVSGFFVHFSLRRMSVRDFLRVRIVRILAPLLATGLLVNPIQTYLLYRHREGRWLGLSDFLVGELPRSWIYDCWITHLWFLIILLIYFLVAAGVFAVVRGVHLDRRFRPPRLSSPALATFLALAALSGYALFVGGLSKLFPNVVNAYFLHFIEVKKLLVYACYFVFGVFLFENPVLERCFLKINPAHGLLLALAAPVYAAYKDSVGLVGKAVELYAYTVLVWVAVAFCFNFFMKFCNRSSRLFRYLSEASYSIYLFHHVIVIALGMAMIPLGLSCGVKFTLLVAATLMLTLAIHHFLILRFAVLRFLFNGKTGRLRPATAAVPAIGIAGTVPEET
jgi:glucan biosynthesis protein C